MQDKEIPIDVKFGICAFDTKTKKLLHFVGYEERPNPEDFVALRDEFMNCPELNMSDKEFVLADASEELVVFHRNILSKGYDKYIIKES